MTIVVWDGKTLAADKQATTAGLKRSVTKIRRISGCLVAVSGDWDRAQLMFDWVAQGCKREEWPKFQEDDNTWVGFCVVERDGVVWKYERAPVPMKIEDKFFAMGSGRDYAYGALAMGADAVNAVAVACLYDNGCGMGIDKLTLEDAA